jgi:hypothetical protein
MRYHTGVVASARFKVLLCRARVRLFVKRTFDHTRALAAKVEQMKTEWTLLRLMKSVPLTRAEIACRQMRIQLHRQLETAHPCAQMAYFLRLGALHRITALRMHKAYGFDFRVCHNIARFCRNYLDDMPSLPFDTVYAVARFSQHQYGGPWC